MEYDPEKQAKHSGDHGFAFSAKHPSIVDENNAVPGESFEVGDTLYAKLQRIAGRFGVEQRGIERVPDNERHEGAVRGLWNVGSMVRDDNSGNEIIFDMAK